MATVFSMRNAEKITEEAPNVIEHEELETLVIASTETLK